MKILLVTQQILSYKLKEWHSVREKIQSNIFKMHMPMKLSCPGLPTSWTLHKIQTSFCFKKLSYSSSTWRVLLNSPSLKCVIQIAKHLANGQCQACYSLNGSSLHPLQLFVRLVKPLSYITDPSKWCINGALNFFNDKQVLLSNLVIEKVRFKLRVSNCILLLYRVNFW